MGKRTWLKRFLYASAMIIALAGIGLLYLGFSKFTYYDNGKWVKTNLLSVYLQAAKGYGNEPIEARLLPADWGSDVGYAARNFTLNLARLDYSMPLSWQDTVVGDSLWVMRPAILMEREKSMYPTSVAVAAGERVEIKVQVVDDAQVQGFATTDEGLIFSRAYPITLYRPRFSHVAYVVEVGKHERGAPVGITDPEGAAAVVRKQLEAERDNDLEAWLSTQMESTQKAYREGTANINTEFGVISLTVGEVRVAVWQTHVIRVQYSGSELAESYGWSDEYIAENMVAVYAEYAVDYDNTKVPYHEGSLTQYFFLVREDRDSPWLYWDAQSPY